VINTYLSTSKEFQALTVTRTVDGVSTAWTTDVQYVAVRKGTPLASGTLQPVTSLGGRIGFYTDTLTPGWWEIGVKVTDAPEEPFVSCGIIHIK
jgi:hypothetical protein